MGRFCRRNPAREAVLGGLIPFSSRNATQPPVAGGVSQSYLEARPPSTACERPVGPALNERYHSLSAVRGGLAEEICAEAPASCFENVPRRLPIDRRVRWHRRAIGTRSGMFREPATSNSNRSTCALAPLSDWHSKWHVSKTCHVRHACGVHVLIQGHMDFWAIQKSM